MKYSLFRPLFALSIIILLVLACDFSGGITPSASPTKSNPATQPPQAAATATTQPQSKYFQEDFTNGAPNWSYFVIDASIMLTSPGSLASLASGDVGTMTVGPSDGYYSFDLEDKGQWVYAIYNAQQYDDVRVDVSADNRGTNDNNVSLICRYDKKEGWYEFNVANSGLFDIYYAHFTPDNKVIYAKIADGGSNHIKQGRNVNEYGISCKGHTLTLFINGFETRKIDDNEYALRSGDVGISVSSFNDLPAKVSFDWVKISQP